jgi:hypothetical protein
MRHIWIFGAALGLMGCNGNVDSATFMEGVDGARCFAKVLRLADTGETINEDPVVQLTLRVTPPSGTKPFDTTIEATVPRLAVPRKGETLAVVCDPTNPENTELME